MAYNRTSMPYSSTVASPPVQTMSRYPATATSSDIRFCSQCSWQYVMSKHGSCLNCHERESCCNPGCSELAYYDVDLGSFHFCSRKCRDLSELQKARNALEKSLKDSERPPTDLPDTINKQNKLDSPPTAETSSFGTQPVIENSFHGDNKPLMSRDVLKNERTLNSASSKSSTTQGVLDEKVTVDKNHFRSHVVVFDNYRLTNIDQHQGVLISAIDMKYVKNGTPCKLQPLDIVTHIDGNAVDTLCGRDRKIPSTATPFRGSVLNLTIFRLYPWIPALNNLYESGFQNNSQLYFSRHVIGISCCSSDLVHLQRYLGITMFESDPKKILMRKDNSLASKCGLETASTIQSVTVVTWSQKVFGPDPDWNVHAGSLGSTVPIASDVCAIILCVQQ